MDAVALALAIIVGGGIVAVALVIVKIIDRLRASGAPIAPGPTDLGAKRQYSLDDLPPQLADWAEQIRRLESPCVRLKAVRTDDRLGPERSTFGGVPCLTSADHWPKCRDGRLMTFIGQLNFAEMGEAIGPQGREMLPELPARGILLFFYDEERMVWGFDPKDADGWSLIWEDSPVETGPIELPVGDSVKPCRIEASLGRSLPMLGDEVFPAPDLPDEKADAYGLLSEGLSGGPAHQVLGHAAFIQNDPRFNAALVSGGVCMGGPECMKHPKFEELKGAAPEWRLLWQIDTDEGGPGFMWGDCGMMYIMVRDEDLRTGRMDRLWMELQCY